MHDKTYKRNPSYAGCEDPEYTSGCCALIYYEETYDDGTVKVFEKGKDIPEARYTPSKTGGGVTVLNPLNLLHIEIGAELAVSKGIPLAEEEILALPWPVLPTESAPEVYETSKYYYKSQIPLPVGEWWLSWWEK
jgi:hypothetical protein